MTKAQLSAWRAKNAKDQPLRVNVAAVANARIPTMWLVKTDEQVIKWAKSSKIKFVDIKDRISALAVILGIRRF